MFKPLLITIGGMTKSGSTGLFNLVRWICEENNIRVASFLGKNYLKGADQYDVLVQKTHHVFDWERADIILAPKRDVRDCVASKRRRSPRVVEGIKGCFVAGFHNIYLHDQAIKKGGIPILYRDLKLNPLKVAERIAAMLRINSPSLKAPIQKFQDMGNGRCSESYNVTAFRTRKVMNRGIIGGYRKTLSKKETGFLDRCFGWWLRKEGFEVESELSPHDSFLCFIEALDDLFGREQCFGQYWKIDGQMRQDLKRQK